MSKNQIEFALASSFFEHAFGLRCGIGQKQNPAEGTAGLKDDGEKGRA
jgi:hypothetical protein